VTYLLGHDAHSHQITTQTGCGGNLTVPVDGEHDAAANIYGIFDASYTDSGGLTSHSTATLQPRHRQAEHFAATSGVQPADHATAEGGRTAGFIDNGDWISFSPYRLDKATGFTARVSSAGAGGSIQVRVGSPTGTLLGTVAVAPTGSWDTFTDVSTTIAAGPASAGPLYLVFTGGAGSLFDVDSFTFATGASTPPPGGVSLRAHANAMYVSAANATTPLIANKAAIGLTEQYDLVDLGAGNIALRSRANGMYVTAENAGAAALIANRAAVGAWETFALVHNADGSVSLRAAANGMYVTAENAGAAALIANRAAIGAWEEFDLVA
jgi:hypothetical protein